MMTKGLADTDRLPRKALLERFTKDIAHIMMPFLTLCTKNWTKTGRKVGVAHAHQPSIMTPLKNNVQLVTSMSWFKAV